MVEYLFDKKKHKDPIELKGKIKDISSFTVLRHILFTILPGFIIFYTQYLLFCEYPTGIDMPLDLYVTIVAIYVCSYKIKFIFSTRIFILNNVIKDEFTTVVTISLTFIIINTFLAVKISDKFNETSIGLKLFYICMVTPCVLFFQVTSFLCQVFVAKYALQCRFASDEEKKEEYFGKMVRFETHTGLMNVLDCFLRAGPQLIAQFTVLLQGHGVVTDVSVTQMCSAIFAVLMMPWSMTSFQGALRMEQQNKEVTYTTKAVYFTWHFLTMIARIMSISAAIAVYPLLTGTVALIHCVGATFWLWCTIEPLQFCNKRKSWFFLFCCVFGGVYFFFPINIVKKRTFWKYTWFYSIVFVENLAANFVWFLHKKEDSFVVISQLVFFMGIFFMIVYYLWFHPTSNFTEALVTEEDVQQTDNVVALLSSDRFINLESQWI